MMERLFASNAPTEANDEEEQEEEGDSMKLTSLQSIYRFYELRRTNPAG